MIRELKTRKRLFLLSVIICFFTILIYEMLTPMLMDDMSYGKEVQGAGSFFELFGQEYNQYMNWTGRSVAHFMLRVLIYIDLHTFGQRILFNIAAALVFTALTILIYLNANKNACYDVFTYVLGTLLVWLFGISFGQTVLWETGACNYLFTTTIVMTMITLYRKGYDKTITEEKSKSSILKCAGFFLLGILSGWCNENTSGGLLLLMIVTAIYYKKVYAWSASAMAGTLTGLLFMVLAPGNANRSQYLEEAHDGLLGMAARFLKVTLVLKDEFMVLLIIITVLFLLLKFQGKRFTDVKDMILFVFIFFATSYSLILTVTPQVRAFFGAGIFLIVTIVQGYSKIDEYDTTKTEITDDKDISTQSDDKSSVLEYDNSHRYSEKAALTKTLKYGTVLALTIYMAFTYIESGANLARIYREEQNRYSYLEEKAASGEEDVEVPMLDEQFYTKYSSAYTCDVSDDWTNWNNQMIAQYYGFKTVLGVRATED